MLSGAKACLGAVFATATALGTTGAVSTLPAGTAVRAPMVCSRGPGDQAFVASVTVPPTAAHSSRYTIRIDGFQSDKIAHFGLNYIHDMTTDYALPPGATYVSGSARFVPGTGTPSVVAGAQIAYENGLIRMTLPAHVRSGSSYTPPSLEFQLEASAPPGASLPLAFARYRVTANAFLVGDVSATCEPVPKRYTLATTLVTAAVPSP
jgi:hypothetical protein